MEPPRDGCPARRLTNYCNAQPEVDRARRHELDRSPACENEPIAAPKLSEVRFAIADLLDAYERITNDVESAQSQRRGERSVALLIASYPDDARVCKHSMSFLAASAPTASGSRPIV